MPGVDQMQGYNMRYGPSPIMELPLAVNPTGSARSEPLLRTHFRSGRCVSQALLFVFCTTLLGISYPASLFFFCLKSDLLKTKSPSRR